jgi:hypothetical protein
MATERSNEANDQPKKRSLNPVSGAAMGVGVGAALTAATGDGWWIGGFAGFGATVALTLSALESRWPRATS